MLRPSVEFRALLDKLKGAEMQILPVAAACQKNATARLTKRAADEETQDSGDELRAQRARHSQYISCSAC